MKTVSIQPKGLKDLTLPYPYIIDNWGNVGRQDFWKGEPKRLMGFNSLPEAGDISLLFFDFWDDPEKAVGMFPVFEDLGGVWKTYTNPIKSIRINEGSK